MPVIVPFLAAVGTAMGASAAAAAVVGGLVVAGTAMTVIGLATGNKTLTKWGGIISLVGGVGALASGAASAASSSIASSAAAEGGAVSGMDLAADAAIGSGNNIATAGSQLGGAAEVGEAVSGAYAGPESMTTTSPGLTQTVAEPATDLGTASTKIADTVAPAAPPGPEVPTPQAPTMDTQYAAPAQYQGTGTSPASGGGIQPAPMPDAAVQASSQNFWDSLKKGTMDLAKSNGGGKIISGLVQGIGSGMAQQSAVQKNYDLQQQAIEANRKRYTDSLKGLTVGTYQPPPKG